MRLTTLLVSFACVLAPQPGRADDADVLLIVLDDWGVDWFEPYSEAGTCSLAATPCDDVDDCPGGETCDADYPVTPTFDRLRDEGLLFRNAWTNPVCSATRASFLTGRHGFRTGVTEVVPPGPRLQLDELTVAEVLVDPQLGSPASHVSAAVGKWHLGGGLPTPGLQGFDFFSGVHTGVVPDYFDWTRTVDGVSSACAPASVDCPDSSYVTSVMVDDAVSWVSGRAEPWFLYLGLVAPHEPFQVPPHELVSASTLAELPQVMGAPAPAGTVCTGPGAAPCYKATIEAADREVSRFLSQLTRPVSIILVGDNGTPGRVTRAPFDPMHAKGQVYEGGVNTPLVLRHHDRRGSGTETSALVHAVDLFATILDLTGACPPMDRTIDGRSLLPLLDDPTLPWSPTVYAELTDRQGVRNERFKLVRHQGVDELYDLAGMPPATAADPFEQFDLLLGTCSVAGTPCRLVGECPIGETCDVPPLDLEADTALSELQLAIDALQGGAGTVPDGHAVMGPPLRVSKGAGEDVVLSWGPSCSVEDIDFAIYEGAVGDYRSHEPANCSTGGLTTDALTASAGSRYFLVASSRNTVGGSLGFESDGAERPPAGLPCLPQLLGRCPWMGSCSD